MTGTIRGTRRAAAAAAVLLATAGGLRAQTGAAPLTLAGDWTLQTLDGKRKCVIALRKGPAERTQPLGAPATCRRAIPDLAGAQGWTQPGEDRIDIVDRAGAPLLSFSLRDGVLQAMGPSSQTLALLRPGEAAPAHLDAPQTAGGFEPVHPGQPLGQPRPAAPAKAAADATASVPQPTRASTGPRPSDMPGRYSVLRETSRDTGCMLTLAPGGKAQLAPACRDHGIVVFDPVNWSYGQAQLALRARKGHTAYFFMTVDGSFQRDPKEGGKPLGLRKM